ncbi:MAG TPA: NUDIX hydrolase [Nitrospiria bacterium]|nr:NUDIX hydrolase [Nitrospiria bacterium]
MKPRGAIHQISSGGVIFRRAAAGIEIALIRKTLKNGKQVWCLPKGWVEPDESLEGAAVREVREETGLEGEILRKIGETEYQFYSKEDRAKIDKTVHFYLMNYRGGDTTDHDQEVEDAAWFPLDAAEAATVYPTEKEIVQKARDLLRTL